MILAFPGGSPELALSNNRIERFTDEIQKRFGVEIVDSIKEVVERSDAILLESIDGSVHLEQLRNIVLYGKPVFIDKPFSLSSETAQEMIEMASAYNTPIMSSSALRFEVSLTNILKNSDKGNIIAADCFGPMEMLNEQQGYFWYGIHLVEMLFTILGGGVESVSAIAECDQDLILGIWKDGRIGTARGIRSGTAQFGGVIHFEKGSEYFVVNPNDKPFYSSLLEEIIKFFGERVSGVPVNETLEIVRMLEAANESKSSGKPIFLYTKKAEVK